MALLAIVGVAIISGFSQSAVFNHKLYETYSATELARSVLEEYLALYPNAATFGDIEDLYSWTITETDHPPLPPSKLDELIKIMDVEITLTAFGKSKSTRLMQSVVRRK